MQSPTSPTPICDESSILVSMSDGRVVICPPRPIDLDTTYALVDAAASAVAAGATVLIDLDPDTTPDDLTPLGPVRDDTFAPVTADHGPARILAPGIVRLSTYDTHWTIDLARGRLLQSDSSIEPFFVPDAAWMPVRALWVTCAQITALGADGTYRSTRTAWTAPLRRPLKVPA